MAKELQRMGRLALRHEGENWSAYYALPDSMEGAIFLGSIRMGAIVNQPHRKREFMDLMQSVVGDILEKDFGVRPTWGGPETAPEHERAGEG